MWQPLDNEEAGDWTTIGSEVQKPRYTLCLVGQSSDGARKSGLESRGTGGDVAALTCGCLSLLCGCLSLLYGCLSLLCGCFDVRVPFFIMWVPFFIMWVPFFITWVPFFIMWVCLSLPVFRTVISPRSNAATATYSQRTSAHLFKAHVDNVRCCFKKQKQSHPYLDMPKLALSASLRVLRSD